MSVSTSKFLSYVLRHAPESIGLELDPQGWASVDELIEKANAAGTAIDEATLRGVVAESDKKRFTLSDDGTKIRAAQGHSVSVDLALVAVEPPQTLFHGTATRFLQSIAREGLSSGSRQHVHLSADEVTATAVGTRHGKPLVLLVDSARMHADGHTFFRADNGVWLTDKVPVAYLRSTDGSSIEGLDP